MNKHLSALLQRKSSSKITSTSESTRLAKLLSSSAFSQTNGSSFSNEVDVLATLSNPTTIEATPETWRDALFADTFTGRLASYHDIFWDWLWALPPSGPGVDGRTCHVELWARGWAKSTNVECGVVALAAKTKRRYGWYISGKQTQADDHLSTVSLRFTSPGVAHYYPKLAEAKVEYVGERSRQLGWRRRRIWTADGFVVDALGLDSANRGAKLGDQRPDFMIFDDVDEELDSEETIERKIAGLTRRVIPAAAPGCVFLVAQNLVHPNGIVTQLADGRANFLGNRFLNGPHPAIEGLQYRGEGTHAVITGGKATWELYGLEVCQRLIEEAGIDSFLAECQHQITYFGNPRFDREALAYLAEQCTDPVPARLLPEWAHDPYLSVWNLPVAGVPYVAYFDGAEGVGSDYCVTALMRVDTRQLVALLRDNKREQAQHAKVA